MSKQEIIEKLNMKPLDGEGGYVSEVYKSQEKTNGFSNCGTILYLETPDDYSRMHRLSIDEIYYYHDGPALEMLIVDEQGSRIVKIGKDIENNEYPQYTVKANSWQGSHLSKDGEYTLVSTSMVPAFEASKFELASYDKLKDKANKEHLELLKLLTK